MKKYLIVIKNMASEIFAYRLNFVLWRIRVILSLFTVYFLWSALFDSGDELFGYTLSTMLSYILISYFINSFVTSSRSYAIGEEIIKGSLSNFLIRPFSYFGYWFAKDIGDKIMNILFTIVEFSMIILIFKPPLFIQTDLLIIVQTIIAVLFGIVIIFLINILLSSIGFWSQEIWAPRFILFGVLIGFFSGNLFPLDILPESLFKFFQSLPFAYLIYFPVKLYLGELTGAGIIRGLTISLIWIFILYFFVRIIWQKGLRTYGAYGK